MKKIIIASFVMLAIGGVSFGQAPVAKTTAKKETIKPASSVTSVTPAATKSTVAKPATANKPPATTSTQKVPATAIRKHKKHAKPAKKS